MNNQTDVDLKVGNSMVVEIHFTLKNNEGEILDSSKEEEPYTYIHGAGNIVPGLEDALEDLSIGSEFEISVPPEKGYGVRDIRQIREIPRNQFAENTTVEVGQMFVIQSTSGLQPVYIKKVLEETVVIDGNHELAGETLHYSGRVISIREATESELLQGQVGSTSCCNEDSCCPQN